MKKSTVFLVIAFCLAICWTILVGWFAAYAINNYRQGKDPYFARSHQQFLESRKKLFAVPVKELLISAEGSMTLTILAGKELAVLSHPRIWDCKYTAMENGKAMISFTKLRENNYDDPVTILLPGVPSVSLENFYNVTINGLNRKEFHLQCKGIHSFISSNCTVGTLCLDFPGKMDQQDICMNKSDQIDTLIASIRGSGRIRLETAATENQISLSDSIYLEATCETMKKLVLTSGDQQNNSKFKR